MPIEIEIACEAGSEHEEFLRDRLARAAGEIERAPQRLSVAIVGDITMAELHQRFLGVPEPTDVLTFELERDGTGGVTEGEVVICLPEAERQAAERGRPVAHELLLYALHGLLHLSGYDDRDEAGFAAMHAREDEILESLGLGRVFDPRGGTV